MKTITSISGGKTSAYLAKHYPTDENIFALIRIEDRRCTPKDKSLVQKISDKIGMEFIATAESDSTLKVIFDLEQLGIGVKQFVFNIEQCIINTLTILGIESERIDGRIGIWLGKGTKNERKIAAIGIKCSRHITMHGLAFNVNTDLSLFNNIIPLYGSIVKWSNKSIEQIIN
jgi:hypothetical protein